MRSDSTAAFTLKNLAEDFESLPTLLYKFHFVPLHCIRLMSVPIKALHEFTPEGRNGLPNEKRAERTEFIDSKRLGDEHFAQLASGLPVKGTVRGERRDVHHIWWLEYVSSMPQR